MSQVFPLLYLTETLIPSLVCQGLHPGIRTHNSYWHCRNGTVGIHTGTVCGIFCDVSHQGRLDSSDVISRVITVFMHVQQLEWFVRSVAQLHELGDVHGALQPHSVVNSVEQRGPAFRDLNSASRIGAPQALFQMKPDAAVLCYLHVTNCTSSIFVPLVPTGGPKGLKCRMLTDFSLSWCRENSAEYHMQDHGIDIWQQLATYTAGSCMST